MEFNVATRWGELSEWQREEICHLLFQTENTEHNYLKMIEILFLGKNTPQNKLRVAKLFSQVPISQLAPYGEFMHKTTELYDFPDISETLKTPAIRLNDCTIKQFSFADAIYYKVATNNWNDLYMRQLVASLYCLSEKEFDVVDLPKVAEMTDKISAKKRARIVFAYLSVRSYIIAKYPKIFSAKNVSEDENQPVFRSKSNKYTPFSKVIATMVFDEKQPLGNLHDCNRTRIYDFFDIFQEAISR